MGLRFRKSVKLGKGVRLNLGKKSAGLSFGGKGARIGFNSKGRVSTSFGVPGTGLSYTTSFGGKGKRKSTHKRASNTSYVAAPKKPMKTGLIPLIVTVFFGWIGGHWFLSGRWGMGFLYLFTLGLFGIGWVIDIIKQVCAFINILNNVEAEANNEGQE